jgi:hypothetical protein
MAGSEVLLLPRPENVLLLPWVCGPRLGLRLLDPLDRIAQKLNGNEGRRIGCAGGDVSLSSVRVAGCVEENNLENFWTLQMTVKMHGTEGLLELVPFICLLVSSRTQLDVFSLADNQSRAVIPLITYIHGKNVKLIVATAS